MPWQLESFLSFETKKKVGGGWVVCCLCDFRVSSLALAKSLTIFIYLYITEKEIIKLSFLTLPIEVKLKLQEMLGIIGSSYNLSVLESWLERLGEEISSRCWKIFGYM